MEEKNITAEKDLFGFASFDKYESEHIAAPQYSYWKSVWRTFIKNKFTVAVAILMIVLVLFALIQPMFSGYDPLIAPNVTDESMRFVKPCKEHIFGTDNVGNEVFDVVWAGARNSIIISFVCTFINMIIGVTVGAIWGFSKKMDKWMIEVYNVVSTDAMTADWFHFPYDFLEKVSNDIINKVRGVNRVVYDISSKPPATIEWE